MRTNWALAQGKTDSALQAVENIFKIADTVSKEPFVISSLVNIATKNIGLYAVKIILQSPCSNNTIAKLRNIIEHEKKYLDKRLLVGNEAMCFVSGFEYAHNLGILEVVRGCWNSDYGGNIKDFANDIFRLDWDNVSRTSKQRFNVISHSPESDLLWGLKHNKEVQKHINLPYYKFSKIFFLQAPEKYILSQMFAMPWINYSKKYSMLQARFLAAHIAFSKRLGKEVDKKDLINPMTGNPFRIEETDKCIKVIAKEAIYDGSDYIFEIIK